MKSQRGFFEGLVISIFVLVVALIVLGFGFVVSRGGIVPIHYVLSEGERVGQVYKLSRKGILCKTFEGEMNLGGAAADSNGQMVANTWQFTVTDPAVVKEINARAESGKRATLVYVEFWATGICEGHTNYVVTGIH